MIRARAAVFLAVFSVSLGLGAGAVASEDGPPHTTPIEGSQVAISGWPFYVENLTVGSPVADFGSHFGVKASVTDDGIDSLERYVPASSFLNHAHYAAYTDLAGQIDQAHLVLLDTFNGTDLVREEPVREIQFFPYGWTEKVAARRVRAQGAVATIAEDVFLVRAEFTCESDEPISIQPILRFQQDGDPIDESLNLRAVRGAYEVALSDDGPGVVAFSEGPDLVRALVSDRPFLQAETGEDGESADLVWEPELVSPGQTRALFFVLGVGRDLAEAASRAAEGMDLVDGDAKAALARVEEDWESFFDDLPVPQTSDPERARLFRMAATGLRMNVYAPRGAMDRPCSVPAKAHFNRFWAWDTALHAVGRAEFDPALAKTELTTLFSGPEPRAFLEMGDDLVPTFGTELTQPPVQGFAVREVYRKDGMRDRDWLEAMYEAGKEYLAWWEERRDPDGNGLYRFDWGLETGWDDSPRYHCRGPSAVCPGPVDMIEPVDLNAWLYAYYEAMERFAMELDLPDEQDAWSARKDALGAAIEALMWDEETGAYYDLERNESGDVHVNRVLTPAILFPLFVGVTTNPQRAAMVIERHLLVPGEFWGAAGNFPVPTVAFSDGAYDWTGDGFYWQGQSWLVTTYATATALYRYGYEAESRELVDRTLDAILAADPGGIYEAYDAATGRIGFGLSGRLLSRPGEPSAFQFGWSCALVMEMLLSRQETFRYLMPGEDGFSGYLLEVRDLLSRRQYLALYEVGLFPPFTEVRTTDGRALDAAPTTIRVRFTDPYGNVRAPEFLVNFTRIPEAVVERIDSQGQRTPVSLVDVGGGVAFRATLTPGADDHYLLTLPVQDTGEDDDDAGGCGCDVSGDTSPWSLVAAFSVLLALRRRLARR